MNASVFVGVSVDGFLARPDGAFDFLPDGGGETIQRFMRPGSCDDSSSRACRC